MSNFWSRVRLACCYSPWTGVLAGDERQGPERMLPSAYVPQWIR
jgi:hypothetical protein